MTEKRPLVAVAQPIDAKAVAALAEHCEVATGDGWRDALDRARGLIVRNAPVDAAVLAAAPALEVIARVGVGTDTIDLAAAAARGVPVAITPDANSQAVAEHTMALILGLQRRLVAGNAAVRDGRFAYRDLLLGHTLAGRTLGIVGFGRIGRRVASLARAFGLSLLILTTDNRNAAAEAGTVVDTLPRLLAGSDIVTLHVPLTPETRGMIGAGELAAMRPGAALINTARGGLVDTQSLAEALHAGRLGGAAIDVYDAPPAADHPLIATDALLTPHVAALTEEAFAGMSRDAVDAVLAVLQGGRAAHVANRNALERAPDSGKEIVR